MDSTYYFDHNACTPADPRVLARFHEVEASCPGNPGSLHAAGRRARGVVEESRFQIAQVLGVEADDVFFVSGGTEANNMVVLGGGDPTLPVLCAPVEHPSVSRPADTRGVISWRVDARGAAIVAPPDRPIGLIALVHGQNEVGTLQPIDAACDLATELGVPIHIDVSQTLGRCPLRDVIARGTSIAFSIHKAAGLRGMGVLVDKSPSTRPRFFGGGQQRARRPGTESPSLAAATALAMQLAIEEQQQRGVAMAAARDAFVAELQIDGARLLTPEDSLPNTAMFHFAGVDGRELLPGLDMAGVEASQGSACSTGSPTPPVVLHAMGLDEEAARACVRFSFSHLTAPAHAAAGGRVVVEVVDRLRRG